jgi:hypothetical protein
MGDVESELSVVILQCGEDLMWRSDVVEGKWLTHGRRDAKARNKGNVAEQ